MIDLNLGRAVAMVAFGGAAVALLVLGVALFGGTRTHAEFAALRRPFAFAAASSVVTLSLLGSIAFAGWLGEPLGILGAIVLLGLAGRPWSTLTRRLRAERDARDPNAR